MGAVKRVFGVGKIRIGTVGAVLDATNEIGDVQSLSLEVTFEEAKLMNTPEESMFAVAVAYHGGKASAKVSNANLNRDVILKTCGAVSSVAGGITTLTLTRTAKPTAFRFEYHGVDTDGNAVIIIFTNATAPGLALALGLSDWAKSDFSPEGYPDTAGDVVLFKTTT